MRLHVPIRSNSSSLSCSVPLVDLKTARHSSLNLPPTEYLRHANAVEWLLGDSDKACRDHLTMLTDNTSWAAVRALPPAVGLQLVHNEFARLVHNCICACTCARACMCACVHACMCVLARTCVHVCTCPCVHVCACMCMRACACVRVHACLHGWA